MTLVSYIGAATLSSMCSLNTFQDSVVVETMIVPGSQRGFNNRVSSKYDGVGNVIFYRESSDALSFLLTLP